MTAPTVEQVKSKNEKKKHALMVVVATVATIDVAVAMAKAATVVIRQTFARVERERTIVSERDLIPV